MAKVLSLFDGMSCGMLAMIESGIEVERYVAFEIDKYAIQTSTHNFPWIEQRGDVFKADFTEFRGFDWLVGGSPCTYWSIAQTNNRETTASGMGWELFSQYTRALREAQPKYFIYENNKSMSKDIRASIDEAFGFEAVEINSALVSAQNRQRLYWVGRRNEDGTYSKVSVPLPEDRGILLKDILEDGCCVDKDKAYCLKHQAGNARDYFKKHYTQIKFEPINVTDDGNKARTLMAGYYKYGTATMITNKGFKGGTTAVAEPLNTTPEGKSQTIKAQYQNTSVANVCCYKSTYGASGVAHPVRVGSMPRPNGELSKSQAFQVYSIDGKSVTLCANAGGAGGKTGLYAVPVNTSTDGKRHTLKAQYYKNGIANFITNNGFDASAVAEPVNPIKSGKSRCITAGYSCKGAKHILESNYSDNPNKQQWDSVAEYVPCFATPTEWDENGRPTKARSCADGKIYTVYEVRDGKITIKGKEYPIKLPDGFYIIRKLTVRECMRLQTVPEWYEFPVSYSQAYKMLGNGWTVLVISHLINCVMSGKTDDYGKQMTLF